MPVKKILLILIFAGLGLSARAQILHPVKWSYAAKRTGKTEAVVFLKATIDDGWHIYSAYQKEGGPVAASFSFATSPAYRVSGKLEEPKPVTRREEAFKMDVCYFEHAVVFKQHIRLRRARPAMLVVSGNLKFMVCNDHQCLPPETLNFSIPVNQ